MFKDVIKAFDKGYARLLNKFGVTIDERSWFDDEKSVVEVKGWVKMLLRQNGKIVPGSLREGNNIWTNTGREYLSMLMSIEVVGSPGTPFRQDRIAYIGAGTGSQTVDAGVTGLINPIAYVAGQFLAPVNTPPTFPLSPNRTVVEYRRTFSESEITTSPGTVNISELGLFTNGRQSDFVAGSRDTTITNAVSQSPVAYKTFDPLGKKDSTELEIVWQIHF